MIVLTRHPTGIAGGFRETFGGSFFEEGKNKGEAAN